MLVFTAIGLRIPLLRNKMLSYPRKMQFYSRNIYRSFTLGFGGKIMNLLEQPCSYRARPNQLKK